MSGTLTRPHPTNDRPSWASLDVRELEAELLERTVELSRELPDGARPKEIIMLGADITRRGNPTVARWLRIALGAIAAGQDAALYGEMVSDVLGAAAATALPLPDQSLAETIAECAADPLQEVALRDNATPEQLQAAAKALDVEAREATRLAQGFRRKARALLRDGLLT